MRDIERHKERRRNGFEVLIEESNCVNGVCMRASKVLVHIKSKQGSDTRHNETVAQTRQTDTTHI